LAQYPEPGKVKVELAADVGITDAAKVEDTFLNKIISENKNSIDYDFFVYLTKGEKSELFAQKYNLSTDKVLEGKEKKCSKVMDDIFTKLEKQYDELIFITPNVPTLTTSAVRDAFALLQTNEVVLGPTIQGKNYLLGSAVKNKDFLLQNKYDFHNNSEEIIEACLEKKLHFGVLETKRHISTYRDLISASIHSDYYQKIIDMIDGKIIYRNMYS
jgi:glycosyltransferase A (GT-A) superfamily protein (DUF2064 family)